MMLQPKSIVHTLTWCPPWCRQKSNSSPQCTIWLIVLYAIAGGFTSANLYYSHPILNVLANDLGTSQAQIANIPTLQLAGDAFGLLFILPLADFYPRRKFVLLLVLFAELFWIPLCLTNEFRVFQVFSFLTGVFAGTTQIMLPLVAEKSTDDRRAFNIAIVATGPTLGILLARILSGVVANYTSWRNVYFLALGLQGSVLAALWTFMPDYPATNNVGTRKLIKTYPNILWTIVMLFPENPVLVQSAMLSFCTFFAVSSFWTTLTFLLSGPPYQYTTTVIGLFGLIGASTMVLGPLYSRFIIKPLKQPLLSVTVGKTISFIGVVVGTYSGRHTVAGPIIEALFLDAGLMIVQISNRLAIHPVSPKGRNRVNTAFVAVMYVGSLTGTKVGNQIYAHYGGWWASGTCSVAVLAFSYVLVALRGPHEAGWVGWGGGWQRNSPSNNSQPHDSIRKDPEVAVELGEADAVPVSKRLTIDDE